jgi:hypothetical protein
MFAAPIGYVVDGLGMVYVCRRYFRLFLILPLQPRIPNLDTVIESFSPMATTGESLEQAGEMVPSLSRDSVYY